MHLFSVCIAIAEVISFTLFLHNFSQNGSRISSASSMRSNLIDSPRLISPESQDAPQRPSSAMLGRAMLSQWMRPDSAHSSSRPSSSYGRFRAPAVSSADLLLLKSVLDGHAPNQPVISSQRSSASTAALSREAASIKSSPQQLDRPTGKRSSPDLKQSKQTAKSAVQAKLVSGALSGPQSLPTADSRSTAQKRKTFNLNARR